MARIAVAAGLAGVAAVALIAVGVGRTHDTTPRGGPTIDLPGVRPGALAAAGIYLAAPGIHPAGAAPSVPTVPTTAGTSTATNPPGPLQAAVEGDTADGTIVLTADQAAEAARSHAPGFVDVPTFSKPVAVQFLDVATAPAVEATAWAVVATGRMRLGGPAPTDGGTAAPTATTSTAVIFIDAVTGRFLTEVQVG